MAATTAEDVVLLSEIMYNPSVVEDTQGEWIEVYNPSDCGTVSMQNWILRDSGGRTHTIASNLVIPPRSYTVLGNHGNVQRNGGVRLDYEYLSTDLYLANDPDKRNGIYLFNDHEILVDWVEWGMHSGLYAPVEGITLARKVVKEAIDYDAAVAGWCISSNQFRLSGGDVGTPGAANVCQEDAVLYASIDQIQQK
jgi:uncharacterized protein